MNGLLKSTDLTAILIATITVFLTNYFTYLFTLRKEAKQAYTKYRISILEELYTPIYKVMLRGVHPLEGYEGISQNQFDEIEDIVSDKYMLVDPELDNIIWNLKEYNFIISGYEGQYYYDEDKKLLNHVGKQYNKLRKSIGLPYKNTSAIAKKYNIFKYYLRRKYRKTKRKMQKINKVKHD